MQNDWRDGSVQAYLEGKEWQEIYDLFPDVKPSAIRSHIRRSMEYRELHPKPEQPKRTYSLIVSDLHYPFHRPTILDEVAPFAGQMDNLIFGEEQDNQGISKFAKLYRNDVMDETIGARNLMTNIIDIVRPKKTIVIDSNHPERIGKYLSGRLDSGMMRFAPPSSTTYIVDEGFTDHNHKTGEEKHYPALKTLYNIEHVRKWYVKIGKHVHCHPDAYRSPIMATCEQLWKYFIDMYRDIDSISLEHTHRSGVYPYGSTTLYETGCCCQPCNYNDGDAKRPWSFALFLLVQDENGNNIKNETRHIWLD